jgi:hypothetical protein
MDISPLSNALRSEIACPSEMAFVETGILGRGYYPGCRGFSSQENPVGGLMPLGRDFGTISYCASLDGKPPRDEYALTWRHTRDIYLSPPPHPSLADPPTRCTNCLMGVRVDGSAKGNVKERLSVSEWAEYELSCWMFLQRRILLQRPLVVIVFGGDNSSGLLADGRLGKNGSQALQRTFEAGGNGHSSTATFTGHPHSSIGNAAKATARLEVKRIGELYELQAERNRRT